MNNLNIVITVDDNYIRPALIMLESLFEHNPASVHVWLLHSNVCDDNLCRLTSHVEARGGQFTDIRVAGGLFEGAPVNKYFTKEMYYRLLIPRLLPEEEEMAEKPDYAQEILSLIKSNASPKMMRDKLESYFSQGNIAAILYSNPNNPAWICLTEEELQIIGELATKYDVIVLEDIAYLCMDFRKDLSVPFEPPFQSTVARYTDNYVIMLSV